jgi:hypothetical protein
MPCFITLPQKELQGLEAIQKIRDHRLSVVEAADILHLSRSQVHRLLRAEAFRNTALDLVRERYRDFGPTLAMEKLNECHDIAVSKETLGKWMSEAGIWTLRRERKRQLHQPRWRRDCLGELVQIDGSHHWWFEERGPKCALLVYIDDATGKLLHLRFAGSENTFDYLIATKAYLAEWGKPISFYSDKHGVLRATHGSQNDRTSGLTQFGRALYELNIDIICANSPQAKGRVERANKTLQERLVKEVRLRNISTVEAANAFAAEFAADFNVHFGKTPRNPKDMHRPLAAHENLDAAMCRKEVRTLSQALTLQYDKVLVILDPSELAKSLAGKKVIVCDFPDGRLENIEGSASLPYRIFDKLRSVHRTPIVENKRLDEALAFTAAKQLARERLRSQHGLRRTGPSDHMFAIPDGSKSNGYEKRGRKPGRRTDFMNDPIVNAKRELALARMAHVRTHQASPADTPALMTADIAGGGTNTANDKLNAAAEAMSAGHTCDRQDPQRQRSFKRQKISERWTVPATYEAGAAPLTTAVERPDRPNRETIEVIARGPIDRPLTAVHTYAQGEERPADPDLMDQRWEDYRSSLLSLDAIADATLNELPGSGVEDVALSIRLVHELKAQIRNVLITHRGGMQDGIPACMTSH